MRWHLLLSLTLLLAACSGGDGAATTLPPPTTSTTILLAPTTTDDLPPTTATTAHVDFALSSPSFDDGTPIPQRHTCDGQDISPELEIVGLPASTQSVAIIVDDPDAPLGTWDHWVVFDIVAAPGSLEIPLGDTSHGVDGLNSWNIEGYMGPCPPPDETHTYVFTVFALDGLLELPAGADSAAVRTAMDGHIAASVELTGTYAR